MHGVPHDWERTFTRHVRPLLSAASWSAIRLAWLSPADRVGSYRLGPKALLVGPKATRGAANRRAESSTCKPWGLPGVGRAPDTFWCVTSVARGASTRSTLRSWSTPSHAITKSSPAPAAAAARPAEKRSSWKCNRGRVILGASKRHTAQEGTLRGSGRAFRGRGRPD
jgi:hypothetical protein